MMEQSLRYETQQEGSFGDPDALLPLFADPDARGARKWREMFDVEACEECNPRDFLASLPSLF